MPLYSDYVRNLAPDLYWPLTDGAGTVARDWSPNGRNGTYTGTPTLGMPSLVPALDGRSAKFNGSSQYVTRATDTAFDIGTGDFSVAAWFNIPSVGATHPVFVRDTGSTGNGIIIFMQASVLPGSIYCAGTHLIWWQQGSGTPVGPIVTGNGPHHLLVFRRSGKLYAVVDGNVVTSIAASGSVQTGAAIQVARGDNPDFLTGNVQHVAFFKKALTPQHGAEMYRLGMGQGILTRHRGR